MKFNSAAAWVLLFVVAGIAEFGSARIGTHLHRNAFIADTDAWLVAGQVVNTFLDVVVDNRTRLQECILDIVSSLCTSFQKYQAIFTSESLSLLRSDLAAGILVGFVTDEHDSSVRVAVLAHLF